MSIRWGESTLVCSASANLLSERVLLLRRCGSPVERAFADGSQLSDPDLTALIRASLRDIRPYRQAKQRAAAQANAEQAVTSAAAAAARAGEGSSSHFSHSGSSYDDVVSSNSMLASLDLVSRYAPGSPLLSMHLGTEGLFTDAQENAGTAAAAAVAVAAAAAASQGGTCSFAASPTRDLTPFIMNATPSHTSSSSSLGSNGSIWEDSPEQKYVCMTVNGAAGLARAAFKPQRMRSFLDLASELLAPQRVAIAMAVLDNVLRIGEHRVAVGPVCEIKAPTSSNGGSNGAAASAATAALALLAAVPTVVSQRLIDAAVGAAADVAAGGNSRQTVLHLADTVLALATVQQEVQLQNQQQQQQQSALAAAPAASAASHKLEVAAAAMHCALGDPHSCVTAEELVAAAAAAPGRSAGSSVTPKWQLMVTLVGLHVTLLKDLAQLWWAYHTAVALHLRGMTRT
jgi:hypothetical protein